MADRRSFNINNLDLFIDCYNQLVNAYKTPIDSLLIFKRNQIYFSDGVFGVRLTVAFDFETGFQVINPQKIGSGVALRRSGENLIKIRTNDLTKKRTRVGFYTIEMSPLDEKCKTLTAMLDDLHYSKKEPNEIKDPIIYDFGICHQLPSRVSGYLSKMYPFWKTLGVKDFYLYKNKKDIWHASATYFRTFAGKEMLVVCKG